MEQQDKKEKKSKIPWTLLFNIFIFGLTFFLIIYFIVSKDGIIDLIKSGMEITPVWLIVAVFVHLANITIDAFVIYLSLKQTEPKAKKRMAITTALVGQFYCAITPSATGGQPMQILSLTRMGISGANATSTLISKFLVWQFTLTIYSIVAFIARFSFFMQNLSPTMWIFAIIGFLLQVAVIVGLLLASFSSKTTSRVVAWAIRLLAKIHILKQPEERIASITASIRLFSENNKNLRKNKRLLVQMFLLTALQMTAFFLVPFCIAQAFGIKCNVLDMLFAQAYVNMVSSLMPLPGGSGAAEYCFSAFFATYFSELTMKSAILLWRTITYYGTIVLCLPFSGLKKKTKVPTTVEEVKETAVESAEAVATIAQEKN